MITADQLPPRMAEGDPRGPLTFARPLPEPWQTLEDSTQSADFDRAWTLGRRFHRPSTATEIDLLTALGYRDGRGDPPGPSTMTAVHVSGGIRTRTWPSLYEPTSAPAEPTPPPTPAPEPEPAPAPAEDPTTEPTTPGGAL